MIPNLPCLASVAQVFLHYGKICNTDISSINKENLIIIKKKSMLLILVCIVKITGKIIGGKKEQSEEASTQSVYLRKALQKRWH